MADVDFTSKLSTHTDASGRKRTAVIVNEDSGSIDVVTEEGVRLCQINIFYHPRSGVFGDTFEEYLIVDTIDVDGRFPDKRSLVFSSNERHQKKVPEGGNLVSADFRRKL